MTAGFGVVGVPQRIDALQKAVADVAEIHAADHWAMGVWFCAACRHTVWPCATRRAVEGLL